MIPWRVKGNFCFNAGHTAHGGDGIFHPARHIARHGTTRRSQRHVDVDVAVVADVDLVNEAELVDVGGNLGVVYGFQRRHDVGGQLLQLLRRQLRALDRCAAIGQGLRLRARVARGRSYADNPPLRGIGPVIASYVDARHPVAHHVTNSVVTTDADGTVRMRTKVISLLGGGLCGR